MNTTEQQIAAAVAAVAAIGGEIDDHQIENVEVAAYGAGFQIDMLIENVDREESDIFTLDEQDGGNHVTQAEENDTVTQVWGHMVLDAEDLDEDAVEAWEAFRPAGYSGQLHLAYHMNHYAGDYSDDEADATASITMFVVGDEDLAAAIESAKALWRKAIGESAITKITAALEDVQLLDDVELMRIADLPAFCEINRRIASLIR